MKRFCAIVVLCGGFFGTACLANDQDQDPTEPVLMAVTNNTGATVYMDMLAGADVVGASVYIHYLNGGEIAPDVSCAELLCSAECNVATCPVTHAVRRLLPEETYSFTWAPYRFDDGSMSCSQGTVACLQPVAVPTGRYTMTACYSAQILQAPGETEEISSTDSRVVDGAVTDQPTCMPAFEVDVPGYDVRFQVYLQ